MKHTNWTSFWMGWNVLSTLNSIFEGRLFLALLTATLVAAGCFLLDVEAERNEDS